MIDIYDMSTTSEASTNKYGSRYEVVGSGAFSSVRLIMIKTKSIDSRLQRTKDSDKSDYTQHHIV